MTLTAEGTGTVETPSSAPSRPPKPPIGPGAIVGWAAVLVALAAAGLLVLLVVSNNSGPSRTALPGIAENGSVRAIDHRDELRAQAASPTEASQENAQQVAGIAENGSVRAIEHRDELRR